MLPGPQPAGVHATHRVGVADGCLQQAACVLGVIGGHHLGGAASAAGGVSGGMGRAKQRRRWPHHVPVRGTAPAAGSAAGRHCKP